MASGDDVPTDEVLVRLRAFHEPPQNHAPKGPVQTRTMNQTMNTIEQIPTKPPPASLDPPHPADVWRDFPKVQWLVNTNQLTTKGGNLIKTPDFRWPVNEDWYFAKGFGGLGHLTPEEQEHHAEALVSRLANTDHERSTTLMKFLLDRPDAILVPLRGIEHPNMLANVIPERLARRLSVATGLPVDEQIHKTNGEANTGKDAFARLLTRHWFDGSVQAGADYVFVDDVSTTGATSYYLRRHIESQGGRLIAAVHLGLTPRLAGKNRFSPKTFAGDEDTLAMSDETRKRLRSKGGDAILNAVVQNLGIAYDWHSLTDALGRSLAANWRRARTMSEGRTHRGGEGSQDATQPALAGPDGRALPAFRGEIQAAANASGLNQLQFSWAV